MAVSAAVRALSCPGEGKSDCPVMNEEGGEGENRFWYIYKIPPSAITLSEFPFLQIHNPLDIIDILC